MSKNPKRRRSPRRSGTGDRKKTEWAPTEQERVVLEEYLARNQSDPKLAPSVQITNGEVALDHPKKGVGAALLARAFGVKDLNTALGLVNQLVGASQRNGGPDESSINFMVSIIESIKPRDEVEAMLVAQMVAVHVAIMTFARRLAGVENIPQQDSAERAFNKLTRTFTTQLEALKRYRSGGEQKVTVQHIDVRGGQAIVGDVSQADRTATAPPAQHTAPALAQSKQTPMPILNEDTRSALNEDARLAVPVKEK
jgi:hypothetical protein